MHAKRAMPQVHDLQAKPVRPFLRISKNIMTLSLPYQDTPPQGDAILVKKSLELWFFWKFLQGNALAFLLGATVVLLGEVFSDLAKLRTFFYYSILFHFCLQKPPTKCASTLLSIISSSGRW